MDGTNYENDVLVFSPRRHAGRSGRGPDSLSKRIKVLMAVLSFTLISSLIALRVVGALYVSKAEQLDLLKVQQSNISRACAEGWVFHGGKCYFFSNVLIKWTQSRDQCVSMGGHLVIINSQEEQNFLVSSIVYDHWIGLNDLETEGQWLWVDNTPLNETGVEFWYKRTNEKSEPDNWMGDNPLGENCANINVEWDKMWVDSSCEYDARFVCESISAN
ncbi:hypothetical protein UPYG_G00334100 [Umbra pygmaea]|uniref:C-type lectin domain-containing protein n=1 Tax=Umbra pygmaea TaxID=75934 RepID=A0ABD0VX54_UMBPY